MTVGEPFRGLLQAHWYQWDGFYIALYRGFDLRRQLDPIDWHCGWHCR
ncbi:MAG: hypothetical protein OEM15_00150 [Myxococcales bacterium]|nr:hypothetical protein [Myxococcales bacterium]MDH3482839.1 hypothetical protein [Myxococcales bacterium]